MFEVGRVCVKIAGRDSNSYCAIVEKVDDMFVVIEGDKRKRKVNVKHLEPTKKKVDVKKTSSKKDVVNAISKAGFVVKKVRVNNYPKKAKKATEKKEVKKTETKK